MVARLIRRKPLSINSPKPMADSVPWGTPYVAGSPTPHLALIPEGTYSLKGALSGSAKVSISYTADRRAIGTVAVSYENFSGSPGNIINGTESVTQERSQIPTMAVLNWHSDLVQTGSVHGTKVTSPGGFKLTIDVMTNIFQATGTLTTTIDGRTYAQPANGS
jgi:hypothetical protein